MKFVGIIMGILGAPMFILHLVEVYLKGGESPGMLTHHWLSLLSGGAMITGIVFYVIGRRQPLPEDKSFVVKMQ